MPTKKEFLGVLHLYIREKKYFGEMIDLKIALNGLGYKVSKLI
jgi:hypothetical protein